MSATRPALGCIGSGRLASTLLPLWNSAGWKIATVAGRNPATVSALARRVQAQPALDLGVLDDAPTVVLLAVPDEALGALADAMAGRGRWQGRIVLHHAGAHGPERLAALTAAGAAVGVLHPLQVMPHTPGSALPTGTRARCEGAAAAERIARRLARDAGLVPLSAKLHWTSARRTEYHLAATLAANDLAALIAAASRLLESSGMSQTDALNALLPLARGALDQLQTERPGNAVSGPIPRGDAATLAAHLKRLQRRDTELYEIHRLLSARVLKLASSEGRISEAARKRLRKLLSSGRKPRPTV